MLIPKERMVKDYKQFKGEVKCIKAYEGLSVEFSVGLFH
jgi:hypothetical protein